MPRPADINKATAESVRMLCNANLNPTELTQALAALLTQANVPIAGPADAPVVAPPASVAPPDVAVQPAPAPAPAPPAPAPAPGVLADGAPALAPDAQSAVADPGAINLGGVTLRHATVTTQKGPYTNVYAKLIASMSQV